MLKLKKITPTFNHILVTNNLRDHDEYDDGILVRPAGSTKEWQTVIAVGPTVKNCKEGDVIMIDPIRYAIKKHQEGSLKDGVVADNPDIAYAVPHIQIGGKDYMYLFDTDIQFVINEYEETEDLPPLYTTSTQLIS
jgi:hypothetical protein